MVVFHEMLFCRCRSFAESFLGWSIVVGFCVVECYRTEHCQGRPGEWMSCSFSAVDP